MSLLTSKPESRRCAICDTNWPNAGNYAKCPRGHGDTFHVKDEVPIPLATADNIRQAWIKFAAYCQDRETEISNLEEQLTLS